MPHVPYTIEGDVARVRVVDAGSLRVGARLVTAAIRHAAAAGIDKMLVDIRPINVSPPTVAERHWIIADWSSVGRGLVRIAVVVRPDFHDPEGYGAAVAASRGMQLRGFTEEDEAVAWLGDA